MTEGDAPGAPGADPPNRRVFHGRRQGRRLRPNRAGLVETMLPRLRIVLPEDGQLDPAGLFDGPVDAVWLEIGFGAGEHLAWQARTHPRIGMIGCEPYLNGMAALLSAIEAEGLGRVRIFPDDARPLLDRLPDASIGRVFLLFADPWPKRRHHGRRFIQPETAAALARVMAGGAELRIATDDAPLLDWSLDHVLRQGDFTWTARGPADWRDRPPDWPPTRYEQKRLHGRPYFLRFLRRERG